MVPECYFSTPDSLPVQFPLCLTISPVIEQLIDTTWELAMINASTEWRRRALQQCVGACYLVLFTACGGGVSRSRVTYSRDDVTFRELTTAFLISVCFVLLSTYGVRLFIRSVQENKSTIGPALMIGVGIAGFVFVSILVFAALLSGGRW
jgi:hypothetical protein